MQAKKGSTVSKKKKKGKINVPLRREFKLTNIHNQTIS